MKALLCGEGPQDVGHKQPRHAAASEGWMQPMVRRSLDGIVVESSGLTRRDIFLLPRDTRRYRPLPPGHGAHALMAKLRALSEGCDAIIYMVDADSTNRREFQRIRGEVLDGLSRLERIGEVACVPMATAESWLLSDLATWTALGLRDSSLLPRRPEATWGRRTDPASHHPHVDFRAACDSSGVDDNPETRADLASRIDLAELRRKCPISYGAFADDLAAATVQRL